MTEAAPLESVQPEQPAEEEIKEEVKLNEELNERVQVQEAPKKNATPKPSSLSGGKVAVILVRGLVGVPAPVKKTIALLGLKRKNSCVVLNSNAVIMGMIKKSKDYITWGKISPTVYKELLEKRGVEYKGRVQDRKGKYKYSFLEEAGKKYKPYFSLNPPRKGFGRKGIKVAFKVGGALGNREKKMDDLIQRML